MSWYERRCARCGKPINALYSGPGTKYCKECSEIIRKERAKESRRRRVLEGKGWHKKPRIGDKCKKCGYDIIYALEYSHEVNGFLCANCHFDLHRRVLRLSPNEKFFDIFALPKSNNLYSCFLCDEELAREKHHIIPRTQGGKELMHNVVLLCSNCHRIVTKFEEEWFKEWYRKNKNRLSKLPKAGIFPSIWNPPSFWFDEELLVAKEYFYFWLRDNWERIEGRLRRGIVSISGHFSYLSLF
jgi:5-methylcytosine-specific restriction endonuclease McrA